MLKMNAKLDATATLIISVVVNWERINVLLYV